MKKIHRFFLNIPFEEEVISLLDKNLIHQMYRVLKLQKNESVMLYNTQEEIVGEITEIQKEKLILKIKERVPIVTSPIHCALFISLPKKDLFEFIVQKVTEIGVKEIFPIISDRTIKKAIHLERVQKIAKEASEQSHHHHIPLIHEPISFIQALSLAKKYDLHLFFDTGNWPHLTEMNRGVSLNKRAIYIGPEGGWSDNEREKASQAGLTFVSLGAYILKTETASIIATYLVQN